MISALAPFLVAPVAAFVVGCLVGAFFLWPALPLGGILRRHHYALSVMMGLVGVYVLLGAFPCYFDIVKPPSFSDALTCNEFMWHGYVRWPFGFIVEPPVPSYGHAWNGAWVIANWTAQLLLGVFGAHQGIRLGLPKR